MKMGENNEKDLELTILTAIKNEDIDKLKEIASSGFNFNTKLMVCQNLLCYAISMNKLKVIEFLINNDNVDVNLRSENFEVECTPLHVACIYLNINAINLLLSCPKININVKASNGHSILHQAYCYNKFELFDIFIKHGADVNVISTGIFAQTPLHSVCQLPKCNVSTIMALIDAGANINIRIPASQLSILHTLCGYHSVEIISTLLKYTNINKLVNAIANDDITPLHIACLRGDIEIVKMLIENGADVMAVDKFGYTTLSYACYGGNLKLIEFLIIYGVDVNSHKFMVKESANIYQDLPKQILRTKIWDITRDSEYIEMKEKIVQILLMHGANNFDNAEHDNSRFKCYLNDLNNFIMETESIPQFV